MSNIDHLFTKQCSPGSLHSCKCLDTHHSAKHHSRHNSNPQYNSSPWWQWSPPARQCALTYHKNWTGPLNSPMCFYQVLPLHHLPIATFQFHAVSVTLPFTLNTVVIYHPPGPLCDFFDEMDTLLRCSPDDGTPLVVLGDFNIHPEKLHSSEFTSSPRVTSHSPPSTLHSTLSLSFSPWSSPPPSPDTSYGHHLLPPEIPLSLHSLLNSTEQFSLMFTKEASSTLLSFLSSSLDTFCALTSSQHSHPLLWRCSHTTYIEPFHHLFPWPDSLLLSRWHLTRHLAIPHHPDQLQPHLRPYYSCLQGSYSKFTSTETNPRLSWSYSTVSLLLFLSKTLNPTPSYLSQNKLLYANPSDFSTQSNTTSFSLLWLNLASLTLL